MSTQRYRVKNDQEFVNMHTEMGDVAQFMDKDIHMEI